LVLKVMVVMSFCLVCGHDEQHHIHWGQKCRVAVLEEGLRSDLRVGQAMKLGTPVIGWQSWVS
jgi:hypothetical protein